MQEPVSAADANRNFSRILREVREGQTYVITSHGRPVAKISPVNDLEPERGAARQRLFERVRNQPFRTITPWTRDELYEDEE